jgi:hypothetical protein
VPLRISASSVPALVPSLVTRVHSVRRQRTRRFPRASHPGHHRRRPPFTRDAPPARQCSPRSPRRGRSRASGRTYRPQLTIVPRVPGGHGLGPHQDVAPRMCRCPGFAQIGAYALGPILHARR